MVDTTSHTLVDDGSSLSDAAAGDGEGLATVGVVVGVASSITHGDVGDGDDQVVVSVGSTAGAQGRVEPGHDTGTTTTAVKGVVLSTANTQVRTNQ